MTTLYYIPMKGDLNDGYDALWAKVVRSDFLRLFFLLNFHIFTHQSIISTAHKHRCVVAMYTYTFIHVTFVCLIHSIFRYIVYVHIRTTP